MRGSNPILVFVFRLISSPNGVWAIYVTIIRIAEYISRNGLRHRKIESDIDALNPHKEDDIIKDTNKFFKKFTIYWEMPYCIARKPGKTHKGYY